MKDRSQRRAVITGAGAVSPFGLGVTRLFDGVCSGRSAVARIRSFDATTFPVQVAAEVPHEALSPVDKRWQRDRKTGFALAAAHEALASAALSSEALATTCLSLALGLETALLEDFSVVNGELDFARELEASLLCSWPRLRTPADLAAIALREEFAFGGQEYLHMSACAAGADAVACAASLVTRGVADVVVCGGTDSMVNPLGLGGMARLGATSPRAEHDACRPFDARRDGLAMGEGAAVFVIESESHALARGARPLARVVGWGASQDAYKASAPRPDGSGAIASMQRALAVAGLAAAQLDYINAHGTGTFVGDAVEATAIAGVFGARAPRTSSVKGAIGHAMAAAGALELVVCLKALERSVLPGTTGLAQRDPSLSLPLLPPGAHARPVRRVMSNSFGFGGHNTSVILETYDEREERQ